MKVTLGGGIRKVKDARGGKVWRWWKKSQTWKISVSGTHLFWTLNETQDSWSAVRNYLQNSMTKCLNPLFYKPTLRITMCYYIISCSVKYQRSLLDLRVTVLWIWHIGINRVPHDLIPISSHFILNIGNYKANKSTSDYLCCKIKHKIYEMLELKLPVQTSASPFIMCSHWWDLF